MVTLQTRAIVKHVKESIVSSGPRRRTNSSVLTYDLADVDSGQIETVEVGRPGSIRRHCEIDHLVVKYRMTREGCHQNGGRQGICTLVAIL